MDKELAGVFPLEPAGEDYGLFAGGAGEAGQPVAMSQINHKIVVFAIARNAARRKTVPMRKTSDGIMACGGVAAGVLLWAAMAAPSGGATVAHYRFEGASYLLDSSPNGLSLSAENSATNAVLPGSGPGATFPKTVQSATNEWMARTLDGGTAGTRRTFTAADNALFDFTSTLTVETFFNMDSGGTAPGNNTSDYMVSVYGNAAANQAFGVGIINDNGVFRPRVVFGNGTTNHVQTFSNLAVAAGADAFLAMTYSNGQTTVYLATNLAGGALLSQTLMFSNFNLANAAVPLRIGGLSSATEANSAGSVFSGYLDEVRLSDVALAPELFLIPEPAAPVLFLGGAILVAAVLRGRRADAARA